MKELRAVMVEVEQAFACVLDLEVDGPSDPVMRRALLGSAKAAVGRAMRMLEQLTLDPATSRRTWKLVAAAAMLVQIREQLPVGQPLVPASDVSAFRRMPSMAVN